MERNSKIGATILPGNMGQKHKRPVLPRRFVQPGTAGAVKEGLAKIVFMAAACISILSVALICIFLVANAFPAFRQIGVVDFLLGQTWKPSSGVYGIAPMILGSIYVTAGAVVIGVPVGVLTAVYLANFSNKRAAKILNPAVELLAGIPSVVYGFFGLVVIVPFIRTTFGGTGTSMLAASLLLAVMILPTIITVSASAVKAVPQSYYEASVALGASHERSVFRVVVPAAKSGIVASIVLGVCRAIGETMAVMMVAGNQARMPAGILKGVRTLTTNIVMEMGYSADLHRQALIATAFVLFVFILLTNICMKLALGRNKL